MIFYYRYAACYGKFFTTVIYVSPDLLKAGHGVDVGIKINPIKQSSKTPRKGIKNWKQITPEHRALSC
jgi:hypothetical protein